MQDNMVRGGTDPVARAWPRAQKASDLSSMHVMTHALGCMATARVRADEREPAHTPPLILTYVHQTVTAKANTATVKSIHKVDLVTATNLVH